MRAALDSVTSTGSNDMKVIKRNKNSVLIECCKCGRPAECTENSMCYQMGMCSRCTSKKGYTSELIPVWRQ